jgi:hypothetical protein
MERFPIAASRVADQSARGRPGYRPGTAAEILDDEVRWVLTKGKLPTSMWIEIVTTVQRRRTDRPERLRLDT